MAIRKKAEFKVLSVDEISKLNNYQLQKYETEMATRKRKREKKEEFYKYLSESCSKYEND